MLTDGVGSRQEWSVARVFRKSPYVAAAHKAPTTVSLTVGYLSRQGVVERRSDPADRRRTIVSLTDDPDTRAAITHWLARGAHAWKQAFEPLAPQERTLFVQTLETYENGASAAPD